LPAPPFPSAFIPTAAARLVPSPPSCLSARRPLLVDVCLINPNAAFAHESAFPTVGKFAFWHYPWVHGAAASHCSIGRRSEMQLHCLHIIYYTCTGHSCKSCRILVYRKVEKCVFDIIRVFSLLVLLYYMRWFLLSQ